MSSTSEEPKKWKPSGFALKIMEIARDENDFISNETLQELEEMVRPSKVPVLQLCNQFSVLRLSKPGKRIEITQDQLDSVKTVTDVVKQMVEVGKFIFSKNEKLLKYLGPIGTVAGTLKDIIEFFEDEKDDPVMKEFGELKSQLTALSQKMSVQFDDLKAFVVEQDFYGQYTVAVSTLNMYLIDTIHSKSKESIALFKDYYMEKRPQKLVYEMLAKLEIDASNPLKWAMKGDSLQTKATFEKWTELLESVLTQALFIETFATGLLSGSQHGSNMILEKMGRYFELVKEWDDYYLNHPDYWPLGVENLVNQVQEDRFSGSIEDKAGKIMDKLNTVYTNDKFYVVVFGDHIWDKHVNYEKQAIANYRNGTNVIVWRSSDYMQVNGHFQDGSPSYRRDYLKWQHESQYSRQYHTTSWQFNHWQIVRNWAAGQKGTPLKFMTRFGGMTLFVAQDKGNVASRFSKIDGWDHGPGFASYDGNLEVFDGFTRSNFPIFWLYAL